MMIPELTDKIIREGYRITRGNLDKELLLTEDLEEMLNCAGKLQKHFCGNLVDFCSIINGRSGRGSEDCKYCAQTAHIRLAGGRGVFPGSGATVMGRGVSACITGNMLTTAGAATIAGDMQMLKKMGLTNNPEEAEIVRQGR